MRIMHYVKYYIRFDNSFSFFILLLSKSIAVDISFNAVDWFCATSFILSRPESILLIPPDISFIILPIFSIDSFEVTDNFLISSATTELIFSIFFKL